MSASPPKTPPSMLQRFKSKTHSLRGISERAFAALLEKATSERDRDDENDENNDNDVVPDVPSDHDDDDDDDENAARFEPSTAADDEVKRITSSSSAAASVSSPQRRAEALALVESRRQSIVNTPEPSLWEQERIASLEALSRGAPFEHFLVVGLPAESGILTASVRNEPQILFQYSPAADKSKAEPNGLVDSVRHFCFPRGVSTELLPRRASGSNLSNLLVGADNMAVFVFVLDSANEQLFGTCVVCRESLFDIGSWQIEPGAAAAPTPPPPAAAPGAERPKGRLGGFYAAPGTRRATPTKAPPTSKWLPSGKSGRGAAAAAAAAVAEEDQGRFIVVTERVYCFVSKVPYFPLHFDVLRHFVCLERLIKLAGVLGTDDDDLRPLEVIRAYGAARLAMPGDTVVVRLPGETNSLTQPVPVAETAEEVRCRVVSDFVTPVMVRHVTLLNLMQLFVAALLEQRVVVRSTNANALSCVVMSLRPLVLPFLLRGLFIPILPAHLMDYIHAPVPFIIGVHTLDAGAGDWLLYDIDAATLDVPPTLDLPRMPGFQRLLGRCKAPFVKLRELTHPHHSPLNNTKAQIAAGRELNAVFNDFNAALMASLEAHFLPLLRSRTLEPFGESAAAAKQSFIAKNPEHREFYELFLNTQHVAVWIHALFAKHELSKSQS